MKGMKLKWPSTGRLGRTVLMLGVAGATVGGVLLAAAPAEALVGTDTPGTLELAGLANPSSGELTATPTWSTTDACPSAAQGSATLYEVNQGSGPAYVSIAILNSPGPNPITTTETGAIGDTVGDFLADASVPTGTPDEWFVQCDSLASDSQAGTLINYQDVDVTANSNGTYSTSVPAPAVATTTTMVASPNPANSGSPITLTATVAAANSTAVSGSVTFMAGATVVNSTPATVSCTTATPPVCTASYTITGGETTTTSFTAVFTPTSTATYDGSTSAGYTESVNATGTSTAGTIPVSVTITATGSLIVTIPTATALLTPNSTETSATGSLGTVSVTDTRNTVPGFAVYGQEVANFIGSGLPPGVTSASIPNTDLGWNPAGPPAAVLADGATLGATSTNIGTAPAVLIQALAGSGTGTSTADAALTLALPAGTPTGTYTGAVTITYISVAP
jgi:hypothetical protein